MLPNRHPGIVFDHVQDEILIKPIGGYFIQEFVSIWLVI